jgi:hypothetical protein
LLGADVGDIVVREFILVQDQMPYIDEDLTWPQLRHTVPL